MRVIFSVMWVFFVATGASAQSFFVQATPHLNLRDADNSQRVLAEIGYGDEVEVLGGTGRRETRDGLEGEWVRVRWQLDDQEPMEGVVFDAYLWPAEVPMGFGDLESVGWEWEESWSEYCGRVVDGGPVLVWSFSHRDFGGPSTETEFLEVECTEGQARQMLTLWAEVFMRSFFGEERPEGGLKASTHSSIHAILSFDFMFESPHSWFLEVSPDFPSPLPDGRRAFRLTYSTGSC